MGQFSVKTSTPPGSLLGETQQPISFSAAVEAAQMPNKGSIIARVREVMKDRD